MRPARLRFEFYDENAYRPRKAWYWSTWFVLGAFLAGLWAALIVQLVAMAFIVP